MGWRTPQPASGYGDGLAASPLTTRRAIGPATRLCLSPATLSPELDDLRMAKLRVADWHRPPLIGRDLLLSRWLGGGDPQSASVLAPLSSASHPDGQPRARHSAQQLGQTGLAAPPVLPHLRPPPWHCCATPLRAAGSRAAWLAPPGHRGQRPPVPQHQELARSARTTSAPVWLWLSWRTVVTYTHTHIQGSLRSPLRTCLSRFPADERQVAQIKAVMFPRK